MVYNYKFPLNLFIILEKVNPVIYTSECLTYNHFVVFFPKEWYYTLNKILKNELFYSSCMLVDQSCVDTNFFKFLEDDFFSRFNRTKLMVFNIYYFYLLKLRLTFIMNTESYEHFASIDSVFKNSSWLERESSEMFCINFNQKGDIRNILLDYSRNEYPMLKEFPSEGFFDVYYDFFDDQLNFVESEFVEL